MELLTIGLAITTVFCASGWFISHISMKALVRYLKIKGYTLPTSEEVTTCTHWAAKNILRKP